MLSAEGTVSASLMVEFLSLFLRFLYLWLDRGRLEILSWIMRHWTEVLFVSQPKVSIALLADELSPEQQTWRHYLAFLITCRLLNYVATLCFPCREKTEQKICTYTQLCAFFTLKWPSYFFFFVLFWLMRSGHNWGGRWEDFNFLSFLLQWLQT